MLKVVPLQHMFSLTLEHFMFLGFQLPVKLPVHLLFGLSMTWPRQSETADLQPCWCQVVGLQRVWRGRCQIDPLLIGSCMPRFPCDIILQRPLGGATMEH